MTTIIEALKTYLATYTNLETGALLLTDYLGVTPTGYAIIPMAGTRIIERDLAGNTVREFPFAFQSVQSTADELERLDNNGFYEAFSDWMETQTTAGALPSLGSGKTATIIETLGQAYLYEQGQSSTGVYQVQCKLTYEQTA
jgi:hypothetical protein